MILHVDFCARDEECTCLMNYIKSAEIDIAAIHDIDGTGLRYHQIQRQGIAHFTIRNVNETGDWATQIKERVHLYPSFGRAKIRPRKERKTQIDCRAVERIYSVRQVKANVVLQIKFACTLDQDSGKIRPYTPITALVGISQSRLRDRLAPSHAAPFLRLRSKTGFDIAQAFAIGNLRERHNAKMFRATKCADTNIAAIPRNNAIKTRLGNKIHYLRKKSTACVHGDASPI